MASGIAGLRVNAVQGAGEGDSLSYVIQAANPGNGALDAQAKTAMWHAAVAAQVQVPLEGFFGKVMLFDAAVE